MRLVVCESCEAEFKIKHTMDDRLYSLKYCPFCGDDIEEENKDILEEWEDE
tara:strand:- start:829 stop:981 length:153 start_codon:yes stop_codon:yes gene_type:complete